MTVRCPSCNTRYRLPPRSRLGRNPTYRCTRCRHVFSPDEEAEAPAVEEEEETLDALDDDDGAPAFTIEPSPPILDDVLDDDEDDGPLPARRRTRESAPPPERSSPARFALYLTIVVVLAYGLVSIYFVTHPAETRTLFARIPFIGDEMSETHLNAGNIQLTDVRGEYKRVPGDRLVFVISGTAINNAPVPVAGVQIQGRIIGPQEQRQVVYCGAVPENVTDLSVHEINLLQTLKPSSDWLLRPGEQDRFLVAFVDPVQPLTEFAAEVVSVRGAAGRIDSPLAKHGAPRPERQLGAGARVERSCTRERNAAASKAGAAMQARARKAEGAMRIERRLDRRSRAKRSRPLSYRSRVPALPRQLCWPRHSARACHPRSTLAPIPTRAVARVGALARVGSTSLAGARRRRG